MERSRAFATTYARWASSIDVFVVRNVLFVQMRLLALDSCFHWCMGKFFFDFLSLIVFAALLQEFFPRRTCGHRGWTRFMYLQRLMIEMSCSLLLSFAPWIHGCRAPLSFQCKLQLFVERNTCGLMLQRHRSKAAHSLCQQISNTADSSFRHKGHSLDVRDHCADCLRRVVRPLLSNNWKG